MVRQGQISLVTDVDHVSRGMWKGREGWGGGVLLASVWMTGVLVMILQLERYISYFLIADEIPDINN